MGVTRVAILALAPGRYRYGEEFEHPSSRVAAQMFVAALLRGLLRGLLGRFALLFLGHFALLRLLGCLLCSSYRLLGGGQFFAEQLCLGRYALMLETIIIFSLALDFKTRLREGEETLLKRLCHVHLSEHSTAQITRFLR